LLAVLQQAEATGRFVMLEANSRSSLRQMYKLSKAGFCLVIYPDDLDSTQERGGEKSEELSFLGQQVALPGDAAYIAHSLQMPLYPILALRQPTSVGVYAHPAIQPARHIDKSVFAASAMAQLYGWLDLFLMHWPEQWENWPYLHHIHIKKQPFFGSLWQSGIESDKLDPENYGMYVRGEARFLLRKRDMCSVSIDQLVFERLFEEWYSDEIGGLK